jgi:hypothetical protein
MLVNTVALGGNLLMNVGRPRAAPLTIEQFMP